MKCLTSLIETHACQLECFAPAAELPNRTQGLLLPPRLWQILGALGQGAGAGELAPRLGIPVETVHAALRAFEAEGLVSKVMIPSPGQAGRPMPTTAPAKADATTGAPAANETNQPEMLAVEAEALASLPAEPRPADHSPAAIVPTATPGAQAPAAETKDRKGRVTLKFAARSRPAAQAPAPVRLRLGASPRKTAAAPAETTSAPQQQAWPLQPVLDALRAKTGGDPMVGQLLAYRVFLRVPGELLQAAGIRSVCLIEPDLVIRDPKLKQAIETALHDVAGLSWPPALAPAA